MKEVMEIINKQGGMGYLATVDNGKPRVRPWGFKLQEGGKLYFCTDSTKDVYKQITILPYIEFSTVTREMVWVRVSGEISFEEDMGRRQMVLDQVPGVKEFYKSADNPIFKVFYLEHGTASIADFSGNPSRQFEF
jgi:uncharacterized pyridoxamine 5'-phosphate oxidase family protein